LPSDQSPLLPRKYLTSFPILNDGVVWVFFLFFSLFSFFSFSFVKGFFLFEFLFYFILFSKKDTIHLVAFLHLLTMCFFCSNYYSELAFLTSFWYSSILTLGQFYLFIFPQLYTHIGLYLHATKCPFYFILFIYLPIYLFWFLFLSVCEKKIHGRWAKMLFWLIDISVAFFLFPFFTFCVGSSLRFASLWVWWYQDVQVSLTMFVQYIIYFFYFLLLSGCLSCSSFLVFLLFCSRVLLIDMV
jgi:hypothetical protein